MNKRLQKNCLTFSHFMTSYLRHAAILDLKGLCVVCDLSEKKRHTFSLFIKICLAEVRHNGDCLTLHIRSDAQWHAAEIAILHRKVYAF